MKSRKNHTLKLAGILLALVLVTSCFVGGTFAKYVTKGTGTDKARVAKFGVKVTADGSTFADAYVTDDKTVTGIAESVISSTEDKVVAPGTSGKMAAITITGTPEVAVNVSYNLEEMKLQNWKAEDGSFYCPLTISITKYSTEFGTKTTVHIPGLDYTSADAFIGAVRQEINSYSVNYPPKTALNDKNENDVLEISWAWAFEDHKTYANDAKQTDEKDTWLGDQAALNNAATIALKVVTTVTQID